MMRSASILLLTALARSSAECTEDTVEHPIGASMKLSFAGFEPSVDRCVALLSQDSRFSYRIFSFTNTGQGNKIVLRGFEAQPVIEEIDDTIVIKAGSPCKETGTPADDPTTPTAATSMAVGGLSMLLGRSAIPMLMGLTFLGHSAYAQNAVECQLLPIQVEIYVDATVDELVMRDFQSGDFEVCPPESK